QLLLLGTQAREVIFLGLKQSLEIGFGSCREWGLAQESGPQRGMRPLATAGLAQLQGRGIGDKFIRAKGFLVEENAGAKAAVDGLRLVARIGGHIDPQLADQRPGSRAVRRRALDRIDSAETHTQARAAMEFVALGMAAEVVVIFKDENARLGPGC